MEKNNTIQLLLLNESENEAIEITNLLRNEGCILRPVIVSDIEAYTRELATKTYDIILAAPRINADEVSKALTIKENSLSDASLIIIGDVSPEETAEFMLQGANAVIPDEPEAIISLTVKREFNSLNALRSQSILSKQLEDSEKRCQQLINSSRDAIAYVHEGMHILSNGPYYKIFGYQSQEDIEATPIMDLVSAEDSSLLKDFLRQYSQKTVQYDDFENNTLKINGLKEDGSKFQMTMEFLPASMAGEECTQIIIRNDALSQKAQEKLEAKLAAMNNHDQETGLYNRRYFLGYLEESIELAMNEGIETGLLYISLDHFDKIREKLGVIASDQVIIDIANLLKNILSPEILLAHFEAHLFTIILNSSDEQQTIELAEKILKAVEEHIAKARDKSISTTCSIGINMITNISSNAQATLSRAQLACHTAIDLGGNQYHLYVPDANEMDDKELSLRWQKTIGEAIKHHHLYQVYQPVINLQAENTEDYEVLIRLKNEQDDTIYPREFLPYIQSSEQILNLDRWVIAESLSVLAKHIAAGQNYRFFIKLSTPSISDPRLIPWIQHNLQRYKLPAETVIFQYTAHQATENLKPLQLINQQLLQLGCLLSIEHFGKEYNAFALLKHLDVQFLKLDMSLTKDISANTEQIEKLKFICQQASERHVKTIVAYVEEAGSLSAIWQSGAHYIQGDFLQEARRKLDFDFSSFI